ncbi:MAG TPA: sulfotransferase [Longimicrobiales bacterium]|nr:sulfotransferase [Longimicrobiales bacterium]
MWSILRSGRDRTRPRVFQIGFNRCGTKSLWSFFRRNGYRAAHWKKGKLAEGIELARLQGERLLRHVGDWDVYTDMERVAHRRLIKGRVLRRLLRLKDRNRLEKPIYAFQQFRALDRHYPGSKFILNIRCVDRWVESRLRFEADDGGAYRFCRHGDRAHDDRESLVACWKRHWASHVAEVREYFRGRSDDLLIFHIESDPIEKLVRFFARAGHELDPRHWTRENGTRPAEVGGDAQEARSAA